MALKPWYKVVMPREDLREGKPLDAAEFAVHLDQVRDGRAPSDYQKPDQFFERTHLTQTLTSMAAEALRRLTGEKTQASAVFNMATQFGGGKTHALTMLYHLANAGPKADRWLGVSSILEKAGVSSVPKAETAVFVGTEFDSLTGRGGNDSTPLRKTPWGEIAYQLGKEEAFDVVAEHDRQFIEPKGDVIRAMLPKDRPCLILMDEIINYVSTYRRKGYHNSLYNFIQALSETARGQDNVVLVVSIPASELEYTSEDEADEQRFKKMLDRVGKPIMMSAEAETSEIIRRRLFEWGGLPSEARPTIAEYADWMLEHRRQIPDWFPVDGVRDALAATYPFHPSVLSVFERKWQALPRFQRTRGILRLLALWVSKAYVEGYKGGHKDPLIGLGTAPLDDPMFRAALFEQLGEPRLEAAITTDIAGKKDSHALRLDKESVDTIKKARLHRKAATTIFFESNGGQARVEATVPEIRLAVAEPELDIGNVETVLEALTDSCYYLTVERTRYHFSLKENLNKRFADRRASIQTGKVAERARAKIQEAFARFNGVEPIQFPEKSSQVTDRPLLTVAVISPEHSMDDKTKTLQLLETMTRESGASSRTFKNALIWCVADSTVSMYDEARKALGWEAIQDEEDDLNLDDAQKKQLKQNLTFADRDLRDSVWRAYNKVVLLGKDNQLRIVDLDLANSSAATSLTAYVLQSLSRIGEVEEGLGPNLVLRNWNPAFKEWSTKAVRDATYASPLYPRLLHSDRIKETIARGVEEGLLGYVGKINASEYLPFHFQTSLNPQQIEISEDMYIITRDTAEIYKKVKEKPPVLTTLIVSPGSVSLERGKKQAFSVRGVDQYGQDIAVGAVQWTASGGSIDRIGVFSASTDEGNFLVTATSGSASSSASVTIGKIESAEPLKPGIAPTRLRWVGEVPAQKWMNFYTKVLSKFATGSGLKLTVSIDVSPEGGVSSQKTEETKVALQELGLNSDIETR
jgi:hypothetical protein